MSAAKDVVRALEVQRIGWIVEEGEVWPPLNSHLEHKYDGGCAVCRAGDDRAALVAFVDAVLETVTEIARLEPPE